MMQPSEVERFCQHLRNRNYSRHTVASYALDLQLFFAEIQKPVSRITWRDIDHFIEQEHRQGLAATTINRRLYAVKRLFDYLVVETERLPANPVKPSHFLKQGRPLPKKLSGQQVKQLFAVINNRMDRALFLLMLRCGLRVSEVAELNSAISIGNNRRCWCDKAKVAKTAGCTCRLIPWKDCESA
jgi:site-specific recombinase XerD